MVVLFAPVVLMVVAPVTLVVPATVTVLAALPIEVAAVPVVLIVVAPKTVVALDALPIFVAPAPVALTLVVPVSVDPALAVNCAVVTSKPLVASTLPVNVTCPVPVWVMAPALLKVKRVIPFVITPKSWLELEPTVPAVVNVLPPTSHTLPLPARTSATVRRLKTPVEPTSVIMESVAAPPCKPSIASVLEAEEVMVVAPVKAPPREMTLPDLVKPLVALSQRLTHVEPR